MGDFHYVHKVLPPIPYSPPISPSLIPHLITIANAMAVADAPIHRNPQSPLRAPLGPEALELSVWQERAGDVLLDRYPTTGRI